MVYFVEQVMRLDVTKVPGCGEDDNSRIYLIYNKRPEEQSYGISFQRCSARLVLRKMLRLKKPLCGNLVVVREENLKAEDNHFRIDGR